MGSITDDYDAALSAGADAQADVSNPWICTDCGAGVEDPESIEIPLCELCEIKLYARELMHLVELAGMHIPPDWQPRFADALRHPPRSLR